jgi:hypothetical protein
MRHAPGFVKVLENCQSLHLPFRGMETGRAGVRVLAASLSEVLTPLEYHTLFQIPLP